MAFYGHQALTHDLEQWTISGIQAEQVWNQQSEFSKTISNLPSEILVKILANVGRLETNPQPEFHKNLKNHWKRDPEGGMTGPQRDPEYAVKNLMSCRRVCKFFEETINNSMKPGEHYDWINVSIKIKGSEESRSVTMYKYGGTGSMYPATHLNRIRRFNEYGQHIERFECIRKLMIVDVVLNEELLETILKLELKNCKYISIVQIPDINFDETVDVRGRIQNFLSTLRTLETPATVAFHSDVFDPNMELFYREEPRLEEEENEEEAHAELIRQLRANREITITTSQNHAQIRQKRKRGNMANFKRNRTGRILNAMLINQRYPANVEPIPSDMWTLRKDLNDKLFKKTKKKSSEVRKAAKWHMKRVIGLLNGHVNRDRKSLCYHLKMLKKLCGVGPLLSTDEVALIENYRENSKKNEFLENFPFLDKFKLRSRLYSVPKPVDSISL